MFKDVSRPWKVFDYTETGLVLQFILGCCHPGALKYHKRKVFAPHAPSTKQPHILWPLCNRAIIGLNDTNKMADRPYKFPTMLAYLLKLGQGFS